MLANLFYMATGLGEYGGPNEIKRSVVIRGHKTSISLEEPFWTDLKEIAHAQHVTLSALVSQIDGTREQGNLSSAIRPFVRHHFRLAQWPGHGLAGERN